MLTHEPACCDPARRRLAAEQARHRRELREALDHAYEDGVRIGPDGRLWHSTYPPGKAGDP